MQIGSEEEFCDVVCRAAREREDPMLAYLVENLVAKSAIHFSNEVKTICITKSEPRHLVRISVDFISKYAAVPDDLLLLLLHEMAHKFQYYGTCPEPYQRFDPQLYNDFCRAIIDGIKTPLDHWVASMIEDIMINARLCLRYFPHAAPIFLKLYDVRRFPDLFMVPPQFLDRYVRQAIQFDPFSESDGTFKDFTTHYMMSELFMNELEPALDVATDRPEREFEEDIGNDDAKWRQRGEWVGGHNRWYWNIWSPEKNISLPVFYRRIRQHITKPEEFILMGDHENLIVKI